MLCIPLRENDKRPLEKNWPNRLYPLEELRDWRGNVAVVTGEVNNIMVVDFDEKEAAREFYRVHRSIITTIVVTRRGAHFHFAGSGPTRKFPHGDIKGNGGYVVYPKSEVKGHVYAFPENHGPQELKPFPEILFPRKEVIRTRGEIKNVMAYLGKIESIQGQHGWGGLARAAKVCMEAGMSEAEATVALLQWNLGPTVEPKWSEEEIAKNVTRIFSKGRS